MPWALYKEEKTEELKNVMYFLVETLRKVAIMLQPAMEETSVKMFNQLGIVDEKLMTWDSIKEYPEYKEGLKVVEKGEPLFVRLDLAEEVEFLKQEMQK
jgi:methionyl-tRNA synthetase